MALPNKIKYSIAAGFTLFMISPVLWAIARPQEPNYSPAASVEIAVSKGDAIAQYETALSTTTGVAQFVAGVKPGRVDGEVEIAVTRFYQTQSEADRLSLAKALWEAWVSASKPQDVDKARIRLVDSAGQQVGGSKALGGSVIYVD
jgi:hypothetical protein